jgi:2-oxoglutarate ferredoxin oxidoreductase subunit beta
MCANGILMMPERQTRYINNNAHFPFCKGCSHKTVLHRLDEALTNLNLDPSQVVLVTDIGCIGLADALFDTIHTVHTTHGRSTAFATGIALADRCLADGRLTIIVLIGDGGATIGLQHLIHAALLNVDITVIICNNFVYGMTGGQSSCLTPERFVTTTTPGGNPLPPLDLCGILEKAHAPFVARTTAVDRSVADLFREAIAFPGFAAVEILELCTEFGVPQNALDGKRLATIAADNEWVLGVIKRNISRKSFSEQWRSSGVQSDQHPHHCVAIRSSSLLKKPLSIVVGGSAGERVQSSVAFLCQLSAESGLFVTQKNDNPVTQGTGFSVSEVRLSSREILFTGIEQPDVIIVTSHDGLKELIAQGVLSRAGETTAIIADETLSGELSLTRCTLYPLRSLFGAKNATLAALCLVALQYRIMDREVLFEALAQRLQSQASHFVIELERLAGLRRPAGRKN